MQIAASTVEQLHDWTSVDSQLELASFAFDLIIDLFGPTGCAIQLVISGDSYRVLYSSVTQFPNKCIMMAPNTTPKFNRPLTRIDSRRASDDKVRELEITGIVSGKNVLITGGANGLGCAFLNHFLQFGANKICIVDIDDASGKKITTTFDKSHGAGRVIFIHADVSKYDEMRTTFDKANNLMDGIDIVINNAGILDERRWEKEVAVNLGGAISVAMLAMQYMGRDAAGRGGILVNVAEQMDVHCTAQLPVYSATKQAIIGLSQALAAPCNLERTGVKVITLCPGLTETALTIDSPNKLLSRVMKADFVKNLEQLTIQTPYVVAQGLMSVLRFCESGSIWVIENGQSPYEVVVPNCHSLRRLYKNNFTYTETVKIPEKGRPIREVCDNTRTGLMSCA